MAFSAQSIQQRANTKILRFVIPDYDEKSKDLAQLGLEFHHQFDLALALYHGLAGHSGAV